jgi:STE24 endopeptidase
VQRPHPVRAQPTFVDRRVTALAAHALTTLPPQKLIDPRRERVSARMRLYLRPLFFGWAFTQIVVFAILWYSGSAARLRDWLRRRIPNIVALRFSYGAMLAFIAAAAAFPAAFVRYRVDYIYGLTPEVAATWFRDGVLNAVLHAVVVGIVIAGVFALVDRTRLWYLWAMVALAAITLVTAFLEPVTIAPLYNGFTPLAATASARAPLEALSKRAGVAGAPIFVADSSRRTRAAIADVAGFGPTKRIVLSDNLLLDATTPEIVFLTARELGHYAHGDDFRLSLFWTALLIACTALAVVAADRVGFRRDDDPLSRLALVFAFLGIFALVATPLYNGYSRNLEGRADAYALALTHDPAAATRAFVRIADETLSPLCASPPIVWYFYNSPPLGTRIAKATGKPDPCRVPG